MAPRAGIEPATNALTVRRSTTELPRNTAGSLACPAWRGYIKFGVLETIFAVIGASSENAPARGEAANA
jgi:hypothetical protein